MKRVKVLIPFQDKVTGKDHSADDVIEVSDERLAEIKAVNVNMVLVIGEVEPKPKKKAASSSKKKENA
jgi:hypothetical protein